MDDYSKLSASDGTGEAVVANIENNRIIGATTLDVDNVENWPANFIFVTGTLNPNNYIDNASMTIMYGHTDAGNIVIDGYADGYTDVGNTAGQIAIIKPTTEWVNQVVSMAQVAHDNDGRLKSTSLDHFYKPVDNAGSWVVSGGVVAQTAGLTGSFSDIVYYILGLRYTKSSVANNLYTASKDTYVDIGTDGVVDYNAVNNGAASPALAAGHIRIAKVVTSGAAITSVVQTGLDSLGNSIYNTSSTIVEKFFTTVGANTWTKPEGLKYVVVEVQGGGGGSGGTGATAATTQAASGGGGGGGYTRKKILASALGATETATVGAEGTAGASGNNAGGTGGTSSFGSHCSASGGTGGSGSAATTGTSVNGAGAGGTGTGGDLNIAGGAGGNGTIVQTPGPNGNWIPTAFGATAFLSGGNATTTSNGKIYGGGGGGRLAGFSTAAQAGLAGSQGIVIVREFF